MANPTTAIVPTTVDTPTLSTSSQSAVGTNPTRNGLWVFNPDASIAIAFSASDKTAVVNGEGSITLQPGQGIQLNGWTNGINAIAASGTPALTVLEF